MQTPEKMLNVSHISVSLGGKEILHDLSFSVEEGTWLMVAGPNGAGKSTLVHAISQGVPYSGTITFDGKDVSQMKDAERARHMAVLSQTRTLTMGFTAQEIVQMGRYAWRDQPDYDPEAVKRAMQEAGVWELRSRNILAMSGGEQQRVFLAQVFAQNPDMLLLDEPTNSLDLQYQEQIFGRIRQWLRQPGRCVVSVVHDLSLAKAFGTKGVLICDGRLLAQGSMETVFSRENLKQVYSMDVYDFMNRLLKEWQ